MTERATDAARFEPTPVERRRSTGGLAVAAWIAVVVAIVGLGIAGNVASSSPALAGARPAGTNLADVEGHVPAPGDPSLLQVAPESAETSAADTVITFRGGEGSSATPADRAVEHRLVVKGGVLSWASSVVVSVESPAGRVVQSRGFSLPYPDGSIRPDQSPTVTLSVRLPTSSAGRVWVDVTTFDATGRAVADVYRELAVGSGAVSPGWRSSSQSAIAK